MKDLQMAMAAMTSSLQQAQSLNPNFQQQPKGKYKHCRGYGHMASRCWELEVNKDYRP